MSTVTADGLFVIAKPSCHGGFSTWRTPPRGNIGVTRYGLCHRLDTGSPRHIATLGMLATGVTDAGLAEFWARALRKLRKLRFDDAQRRDIARQMLRKCAPLPQEATWPGSTEGAWADVLAELAALMRDQELVV
jgi:hypothetical protein